MSHHKTKAEITALLPPLDSLGAYVACSDCGATDGWTYFSAWARCRCGYLRAFTSPGAPTPEQIARACDLVMLARWSDEPRTTDQTQLTKDQMQ